MLNDSGVGEISRNHLGRPWNVFASPTRTPHQILLPCLAAVRKHLHGQHAILRNASRPNNKASLALFHSRHAARKDQKACRGMPSRGHRPLWCDVNGVLSLGIRLGGLLVEMVEPYSKEFKHVSVSKRAEACVESADKSCRHEH